MGRTRVASLCLIFATAALTLVGGQGQGQTNSSTNGNLPIDQQFIMNAVKFLTGNTSVTSQIAQNFAQSLLQQALGATNGTTGAMGTGMGTSNPGAQMLPQIMKILPTLMNNPYFRRIAILATDELVRAQPGKAGQEAILNTTLEMTAPLNVSETSAEFNQTLSDVTYQYLMKNFNVPRLLNRLAMSMSARDLLKNPNKTINPQCYSDTMDFVDALVGVQMDSKDPRELNIQRPWWAIQMLDSFGKPSAGILKGGLTYLGSHKQCLEVHAYMPKDRTLRLGGKSHDHVTEFDTRFCRTSFNMPDSVMESFGVDTHGITLTLNWGMCFPDSCHTEDVAAMFRLVHEQLPSYSLSVHGVYCEEDEDVNDDASAIFAIVFLSILVGTVVLCTLIEAAIIFYNNNIARPRPTPTNSSMDDAENQFPEAEINITYDNKAFQPDEGTAGKYEAEKTTDTAPTSSVATSKQTEGVMCVGYVRHKEDAPAFSKEALSPVTSSPPAVTGNDVPKTESPPPSYTKTVRGSNKDHEKRVPKLVHAFSMLTNMPKVLNGKRSPKAIHCLHGIRFFSLMWVVLGHTYNYGVMTAGDNPSTGNLVDAEEMFRRFTFEGVMAGGFSVDTFFMLSGLLVTWLTLRDLGKKNSIGYWVMFYIHRFWRLTPLYMIVLMTFTCLHTYLGGGPLWPSDLDTATNCKKYWWTNFIYVNNLVHVDKMCMGWTWYLSNDMQFYWISPIFLLPLFYFAPVGLMMTVGLLCGGTAAAFYFEHKNGGDILTMLEDGSKYWKEVYVAPWCRVAAYTVGMLLGYIFFKVKQTTLKMRTAVIGWLLTWGVGLFLCYIPYTYRKEGGEEWDRWVQALFESFSRPLWAACVAWIVFACHNNRGGFINSILSWQGFLPLSRLTYAAYLVHPVIMMLHVLSRNTLVYVEDFSLVYLFLGHAVISFLTAFFASLIAEAPALAVEKLVFRLH